MKIIDAAVGRAVVLLPRIAAEQWLEDIVVITTRVAVLVENLLGSTPERAETLAEEAIMTRDRTKVIIVNTIVIVAIVIVMEIAVIVMEIAVIVMEIAVVVMEIAVVVMEIAVIVMEIAVVSVVKIVAVTTVARDIEMVTAQRGKRGSPANAMSIFIWVQSLYKVQI